MKHVWLFALATSLLVGCGMPASVPMPKTQNQVRREVQDENAYKNGLMFFLGRITKLNEEMQAKGYEYGSKFKTGEIPPEWTKFMEESLAESKKNVEGIESLKPPPRYQEFHKLFVEYHKQQLVDAPAMFEALRKKDPEVIEKLMKETEERENEWKRKIEAAVRKQGAHSLQEFLGLDPIQEEKGK